MLQSLGLALDGPELMLGDNISVILNTSVPVSVLKKRYDAIVYTQVRKAITVRIMRFAYIKSEENINVILEKPLIDDEFHYLKFHYLMKRWLFRVTETNKYEDLMFDNLGILIISKIKIILK
jgi:hypothetical protein